MVKRMHNNGVTSVRNCGGTCSYCYKESGVTAYYSPIKRLCPDCCNQDKDENFQFYMIPNKKCLKTLFNNMNKFKKRQGGNLGGSPVTYKLGQCRYSYYIESTSGGYFVKAIITC